MNYLKSTNNDNHSHNNSSTDTARFIAQSPSNDRSIWKEVSKSNPCPICSKPDWCSASENGDAALCRRTDFAPSGWKEIKKSSDGYPIYAIDKGQQQQEKAWSARPRKIHNSKKVTPAPIPEGKLTLAKLPAPATDSPKPKLERDYKEHRDVNSIEYWYSQTQWVERWEWENPDKPKGREKTFKQHHYFTDPDGVKWDKLGKGDQPWTAYRIDEALVLINQVTDVAVLLLVEGEKCVEALREIGLAAITFQGSSWGKDSEAVIQQLAKIPNLVLGLLPDNDSAGEKKANNLQQQCDRAGLPSLTLDLKQVYPNLQEKEDCVEAIAAIGSEEFIRRLEEEIRQTTSRKTTQDIDNSNNNIIEHPTATREIYSKEEIKQKIDQFISEGLSGSRLASELADLAANSRYNQLAVEKIYQAALKEIEQLEDRQNADVELEKLITANNSTINISEILPAQLSQPINKLATWLNLKPETYLTALLATTSSLFKVGTRIAVCPATDWEETPQIYAGIVAPSSQKKSPILKAIITKPLQKLQQQEKQAFERAKADYEQELQEYNEAKKNKDGSGSGDRPEEPKLRHYSFTQGTTEGLLRQLQNHSDKGILWNCDELAGLFKGANQYKSGKGDDIEAILSMYDGTPINLLRADETKNISLDGCILSIMGTTQPTVLQSMMKDDTDGNGQWARFCWVQQPLAVCTMPESGKIELTPLLADVYQKVDNLPSTVYRLAPDSFKLFRDEYNKLELERVEAANKSSGLSSCYGKSEGRLARLCLNLHVLWELVSGKVPGAEIGVEIVKKAIALNRFYLAQVTSLYSGFHQDSLAPHLLKVIQLSERKGWIKAKDVQANATAKNRPTAENVRIWFNELVSLGKGSTEGEGRNIQFNCKVGEVGDAPTLSPTNETIDNTLLQEKVGEVGEVGDFQFLPDTDTQINETATFLAQVDNPENISTFIESPTLPTLLHNQEPVNDVAVGESPTLSPTFVESPTLSTDESLNTVASGNEVIECAKALEGIETVKALLELVNQYGRKVCTEAVKLLNEKQSSLVKKLQFNLKKKLGDRYLELPV